MNENSLVPLYQQVKEDIKAAIQRGKYKPKEKIPAEPELSAEYSVSRITIRRAVEELCNEGYLVKMQGRGTFVSSPRIQRKLSGNRLESFSKTCRDAGIQPGARLIGRQIMPSRPDEREFLGLGPDVLLIHIERVRTADGLPIFLENLFLPYEEFKPLMAADLNDCSSFDTIEAVSGRRPLDTTRRSLELARATAEQAQLLSIPLSDPLFYMHCYFIDQNRRPLCIGRQYYVGSRYQFEL